MLKVYLTVFFLVAAVFAESVRETETWVRSQTVDGDLEESGDFGFDENEERLAVGVVEDDDDDDDDDDDEFDDDDEMSGSGDVDYSENTEATTTVIESEMDNVIPEGNNPQIPENDVEEDLRALDQNEVALSSSVQHNKAEQSLLSKKEVLAAVIAGGAVGLLFAVLLILFLVYRMKKKDEGSYDLGKKPIYKKAPTAEIYA